MHVQHTAYSRLQKSERAQPAETTLKLSRVVMSFLASTAIIEVVNGML